MKQIKIIKKVERTPVRNLQGMIRLSKTGVRLPQDIIWQPIVTKPHAQLVISDKQEEKNTVWTAKLTFMTCETLEDREAYAYRCMLTNGQYRLLGTGDRPFPITSVQEAMPGNVSDNQLDEVTVNWVSNAYIPSIRD